MADDLCPARVAGHEYADRALGVPRARRPSRKTTEAQRTAAEAAGDPQQRAAGLAAFRQIRETLERRVDRSERRTEGLTSLVRAYAGHVAELTGLMR
ncbi:hypothetical protein CFC35_22755 [Streptomyces sp. FBKL.4005]|nr:hypothetical protein CFC35_22755 [Streptomyces sp. FBKL.4005]